jgi:rod shape-determining protein MreC
MELAQIWVERKKIILLALLTVLLIIVLARQADYLPQGPAGRVVRTVLQPVVATVAAMDRVVTRGWVTLFRSRDLERDNRELKSEMALLRVKYERLVQEHNQLQRLSQLTSKLPKLGPNVTANVIGVSPNFWTRTVVIDRGRRDGIAVNMPVINQEGLVGVVRGVNESAALVQLLIDSDFAAGARVDETRDRGIVKGTGDLNQVWLVLENPMTHIQAGHQVMTSGLPVVSAGLPTGSLFRTGMLIGAVKSFELDKYGQQYAVVEPAVRFDRLEEVVVLLEMMKLDVAPGEGMQIPPM